MTSAALSASPSHLPAVSFGLVLVLLVILGLLGLILARRGPSL